MGESVFSICETCKDICVQQYMMKINYSDQVDDDGDDDPKERRCEYGEVENNDDNVMRDRKTKDENANYENNDGVIVVSEDDNS